MSDEKDTTTAVDVEIVMKARKIILGVNPVEFLRPHEPALAEGSLATGKSADITPAELAELIAKGGDLEEDIQKLIKARQLQTQLSRISFTARETELIGQSLPGVIMFMEHVSIPLLEYRNEYLDTWLVHENRERQRRAKQESAVSDANGQDEDTSHAKKILSNLAAEVQLRDTKT